MTSDDSAKLVSLEGTLRNLENVIRRQHDTLTEMEDRARRNNLIVFGIPESADETREVIEQEVPKGVVSDRLGVKVPSVERIHRLGNMRADRERPVILPVFSFNEKVEV